MPKPLAWAARTPALCCLMLQTSLAAFCGCASAPPHHAVQLSRSEAAIDAAQQLGAGEVPSAAVHLQLAREQVASARQLIASHQPERAEYLLMRAEADAELALALAREAPARALAQDALDQVQALEESLEGHTDALAEDDAPPTPAPSPAPAVPLPVPAPLPNTGLAPLYGPHGESSAPPVQP